MSSEKGLFSIYYREGNVIYGPNGVDLSEFNCAVRGITRPHERTFESLCNWLMRELRINQETHTVSVQCVINRTTHAFDLGADATCKQRGLVNLSAKCKSLAMATGTPCQCAPEPFDKH
jgi:hypothetical protein